MYNYLSISVQGVLILLKTPNVLVVIKIMHALLLDTTFYGLTNVSCLTNKHRKNPKCLWKILLLHLLNYVTITMSVKVPHDLLNIDVVSEVILT